MSDPKTPPALTIVEDGEVTSGFDNERPMLRFKNPYNGEECAMTFGYLDGAPTIALFHGDPDAEDGTEGIIILDKAMLQMGLHLGWTDHCPCCEDPNADDELVN